MLTDLISLLTCGDLTGRKLEDCAARITASPMDPELDWIDSGNPADFMQFAVLAELGDYVAIGSDIGKLHEEISEQFANPLPDLPEPGMPVAAYFQWLDAELASRTTPYELLLWGNDFDDNLYAFIVRRNDTQRALDLAAELGLVVGRAASSHLT